MNNGPDRVQVPGLSVVIPVYNSQDSLSPLVGALAGTLPALSQQFEVILVNDGSKDQSWEVVRALAQQYAWVQGIDLMRNFGQHNALLCGLRAARYNIVVTMDDDLQHPPGEIGKLLARLAEGYDLVYGAPLRLAHTPVRNWLSRSIKAALARATGLAHIEHASAFRALRGELRQAFAEYRSPNLMLDALLGWGAARIGVVQVNIAPRTIGRSNYNFRKLFNQTMLLVAGFTTGPLRLASVVGLLFAVFGVAVFIYVVVQFLRAGSVPGFPFLASIIALFSGAQLFALGIMGEYLARIFDRNLDRPTYVVRSTLRGSSTRPGGQP